MIQFATEPSEQESRTALEQFTKLNHQIESTQNDSFRESGIAILIQNRQPKNARQAGLKGKLL